MSGFGIQFLASFTSRFLIAALSAGACPAITLENDRVALAFDEETGALVDLTNAATGDRYLKGQEHGGNLFRAYVDTDDILPPAAKAGMPFSITPVEDAMGGVIVDPAACELAVRFP